MVVNPSCLHDKRVKSMELEDAKSIINICRAQGSGKYIVHRA